MSLRATLSDVKRSRRQSEAKRRGRHTDAQWWLLQEVCNHVCLACGARAGRDLELTKDHIVPISRYGCDCISNIQPLCMRCNSSKSARIGHDLRPSTWMADMGMTP